GHRRNHPPDVPPRSARARGIPRGPPVLLRDPRQRHRQPALRRPSGQSAGKVTKPLEPSHLPDARVTLGGLAHDAAAGGNLALTMLPKAMAYAVVAGVPPVYGLYASCAAPVLAVVFGSNRLLFTGPVGVMTVLVL